MKSYSLSNLSERDYNELLIQWTKRRRTYLLLSLLLIPAVLTVSYAAFCHAQIVILRSGGRKRMSLAMSWVYIIIGGGIPLILVPIIRFIKPWGYSVLGTRLVN